jgi:hypothetical protein
MMGDYHVRFRERFRGEIPLYLLDFVAVRLSHRAALIKFYLDNTNSTLLQGPALARQTASPRAVTRKLCYLFNNTTFYRDSPSARR